MKEGIKFMAYATPFNYMLMFIIVELIYLIYRNINQFPRKGNVSNDITPLTILTGSLRLEFTTLKLEFTQYIEVDEDSD